MTRRVSLRLCSRTSSPTIRTLRSLETLQWQNRASQIWQNTPFSWWQCQLNFVLWCASVGFHLWTISKRRSPFLPALTGFTSTIRPGACLKSCMSPSQGINLIHGTRMHMTAEPICGFALISPFLRNKTGGRSSITDVKDSDLGVPS